MPWAGSTGTVARRNHQVIPHPQDQGAAVSVQAGLLDIDVWHDSGRPIVRLAGDIDVYTVGRLRSELLDLSQRGRHLITVDMSGVTFCDSSGLGVMVGAYKRARNGGGLVVLVDVPEFIMRMLKITGLSKIFPVVGNVETALGLLTEQEQIRG